MLGAVSRGQITDADVFMSLSRYLALSFKGSVNQCEKDAWLSSENKYDHHLEFCLRPIS